MNTKIFIICTYRTLTPDTISKKPSERVTKVYVILFWLTEGGTALLPRAVSGLFERGSRGGIPGAHRAPGAAVPAPPCRPQPTAARRPPTGLRVAAKPRSRTHQVHSIRGRELDIREVARFSVERKAAAILREHELRRPAR